MKPKPLTLTTALALAVAVLACQDQGVVAPDEVSPLFAVVCEDKPDHPKCTDDPAPDPDGDPTATVDLAGGLVATMTGVLITNDNKNLLELWNGPENGVDVTVDFSNAYFGYPGACWTSPEEPEPGAADALRDLLKRDITTPEEIYLNMDVYKRKLGLTSDKHRFHIRYTHPDLGMILIGIYGPETIVTRVGDVYEFSGIVKVWDKNSNANEGVVLACETDDVVTVTVTEETP